MDQTHLIIQEILEQINFMEKGQCYGRMAGNMWALGLIAKWIIKECLHGPMVRLMKESISMIKNTGMGNSHGLMADAMMECGTMDCSMVKDSSQIGKGSARNIIGVMVKEGNY